MTRTRNHPGFWIVNLIVLVAFVPTLQAQLTMGPSKGPVPADTLPLRPDMPCSAVAQPRPDGYRVALTPAQEKRADNLYQKSIVITAHDHCFHPDDFRDQEAGGVTVRTIKLTTDGIYWEDAKRFPIESEVMGWEKRGRNAFGLLQEQISKSQGKIVLVKSVSDIYRVKREGKLGVIASFEGGRPLEGKLENVGKFHRLGLRDLQIFWAVPSPLRTPDNMLTPFGLQVIGDMNRRGIVVDLSHLSAAAFAQAMAATSKPIVVSHCGVAGVTGSKSSGTDGLGDDTIRAIAANGGSVCLHFYSGYIPARHGPNSTVEDLVDHVDYIRRLVGIDYVSLGTDYFPEKGAAWIQGAENTRGMSNVAREMVRRGFTDEEIQKVLGLNLIRVYQKVWER